MIPQINKLKSLLAFTALFSCASFPGNKVDPGSYLVPNKQELQNINLSFEQGKYSYKKNEISFNWVIINELENYGVDWTDSTNKPNTCEVEIISVTKEQSITAASYQYIASLTLFTIPYYQFHQYQAKATLKTSSGKILKEYQLNDRAHEVWSIVIPFLLPIPAVWDAQTEQGWGEEVVKRNIAKALTRQIIHDASKFQECRKVPSE